MTEDWRKIEPEKAAKILAEINSHLEPVPFDAGSTTLRMMPLSFTRDYALYELTDMSAIPAARKYAIYKPGDVNVINWSNQVIYELAEKTPLALDARSVVDYVKFFFNYVRPRNGRFQVIESVDDIKWQIEPPLQGRKVIQEIVHPVSVVGEDDDGTFTLEAFMIFKDSLFKTQVHVRRSGLINMSNEELKMEGMPVVQDVAA